MNLTAIPFGTHHIRLSWLKPMTGGECNPNNALHGPESALEYFVHINGGISKSLHIIQDTYGSVQVLDIEDLPSNTIHHNFEVHVKQMM